MPSLAKASFVLVEEKGINLDLLIEKIAEFLRDLFTQFCPLHVRILLLHLRNRLRILKCDVERNTLLASTQAYSPI